MEHGDGLKSQKRIKQARHFVKGEYISAPFCHCGQKSEFSMGSAKRTGCSQKGAILERRFCLSQLDRSPVASSPSFPIQFLQHSSCCSLIRFCLLKGKRPLKGFRPLSLTRCPFFNRNGCLLILTALSRHPRKTGREKGGKNISRNAVGLTCATLPNF